MDLRYSLHDMEDGTTKVIRYSGRNMDGETLVPTDAVMRYVKVLESTGYRRLDEKKTGERGLTD